MLPTNFKQFAIGLGTDFLSGQDAINAVSNALTTGYRHIDTAQIFQNEEEIGQAILNSEIPREELFITNKVWFSHYGNDFLKSVANSLQHLKLQYLDMLLVHWPAPHNHPSMEAYLPKLIEAKKEGLTKHIGVANFTIEQLKQTINIIGDGQISNLQIEVHPYLPNNKVVEFAQSKGIKVTAFMPLAQGRIFDEPILKVIAEHFQCSVAQVVLTWLLQRDIAVIPASRYKVHLKDNFNSGKIHLPHEVRDAIAQLAKTKPVRINNPDYAPQWDR